MADPFFDAAQIRAATFIRHVEIHDELGSTNDRATELARDLNIDLPALIITRRQTAGRGRGKRSWWSTDGALTFSVLLDTATFDIKISSWPQLSLATAVAVCDALGQELESPDKARLGIKWPNDIILDGGKVCGILIESPGGAVPAKDRLIIGVGININNSWRSAPREAGPHGTALCDITAKKHDLNGILIHSLNAIRARIDQLAANDPWLPKAWQQLSWLSELNVEVQTNSNWITGICLGIDSDGALLVEDVFKTHRIFSGSVRVR